MQVSTPYQDILGNGARSDRDLVDHLQKSEIYRDYQRAFEAATGLPLVLRSAGSFQAPLQESKNRNEFCAMMAAQNKTCAACLELQQRMETLATEKSATLECFAGLSEAAVPVRVGERVVAYLQTGQVLLRKPSEARFNTVLQSLKQLGVSVDSRALREAYFGTQIVSKHRHESAVSLLVIFAQHLSSVSNQLMVREAAAESPTVTTPVRTRPIAPSIMRLLIAVFTKTDWSKTTLVTSDLGTSRRCEIAPLIPFTTAIVLASALDLRIGR